MSLSVLIKSGVLAGALVCGLMGSAQAATLSFFRITSNNTENVASQLSVEVAAVGTTGVSFRFTNTGSVASSITDVYFDDRNGLLNGTSMGLTGGGTQVAFSQNATPPNLPSGTNYDFAVNPTGASADSDRPIMQNGVNNIGNEFLTVVFNLVSGKKFTDVLVALVNGSAGTDASNDATGLRIGMHVQSIGTAGGSDSFINTPPSPGVLPPIPLPAAGWMLLLGLGGLVAARRRSVSAA